MTAYDIVAIVGKAPPVRTEQVKLGYQIGDGWSHRDALVGYLNCPPTIVVRLTQANEIHRNLPILTIVLDQIEGAEDGSACSFTPPQANRDKPAVPSTTASPSIVKLLALIRCAAAAIAGSRTVQS